MNLGELFSYVQESRLAAWRAGGTAPLAITLPAIEYDTIVSEIRETAWFKREQPNLSTPWRYLDIEIRRFPSSTAQRTAQNGR